LSSRKEKKYYQHHLVSLALRFCSVALFAGGFALAISSGIKGWLYNRTTIDTDLIEKKYSAKYNQLSGNQIESSLSANSMQHIVQTVDEIKQKYLNNPEKMLSVVSHDISIFSDLRVKKIDWFVSNYADTKDAGAVTWGNQTNPKSKFSNSKIPHTKGLFEIAVVEAEFLNFDGNYRYALNAVDDLEKVMSGSGKYAYVEILKRPLDIEPQNRLTGNVGKNTVHSNPMALLAFRIVREVANGK
jgi:hypothetical protein